MLRTLVNICDREYLFGSYLFPTTFFSLLRKWVSSLPLFVPIPGTSDSACIYTGHVNHLKLLYHSVYSQFSRDHNPCFFVLEKVLFTKTVKHNSSGRKILYWVTSFLFSGFSILQHSKYHSYVKRAEAQAHPCSPLFWKERHTRSWETRRLCLLLQ